MKNVRVLEKISPRQNEMVQVKFGKVHSAQVLSYRHMDKIFIVRIHDMRLANGAFAYICCKKTS